jgi:translation initiation factor IF-2
MVEAGMAEETSYDHSTCFAPITGSINSHFSVLTAEYASLLAAEFDRNPIVNDEAAFDIHPP